MTSAYSPDQSLLCNGGENYDSTYCTYTDMSNVVNWVQNSTNLPYPVHGMQNCEKQKDDTTQFYAYCPSTTPLSSTSTRNSPNGNAMKMDPDAFQGQEANLSDDQLLRMSVRDLNYLLQGSDRRVITAYKQKRRTLKNRGYALSCRVRRVQMQQTLEEENNALKKQVSELRSLLSQAQHQIVYYQNQQANAQPPRPFMHQYSLEESPVSGGSSWSTSDGSPVTSSYGANMNDNF